MEHKWKSPIWIWMLSRTNQICMCLNHQQVNVYWRSLLVRGGTVCAHPPHMLVPSSVATTVLEWAMQTLAPISPQWTLNTHSNHNKIVWLLLILMHVFEYIVYYKCFNEKNSNVIINYVCTFLLIFSFTWSNLYTITNNWCLFCCIKITHSLYLLTKYISSLFHPFLIIFFILD